MIGKILGNLVKPVSDIVSKYVPDKDLAMQLQMELNKLLVSSVDSAREHDKASYGILSVDWLRGMVRPVITLAMTVWYVYCKVTPSVEFTNNDYMILGGVLAFWFGGKFLGKDIQK